jgi:hypothetical protein
MFITRNNEKIHLTDEELETAYREQEHNYLLIDAKNQLNDYLGIDDDDECIREYDDHKNLDTDFVKEYGVKYDDLINSDSKNYALGDILDKYEELFDCNEKENDTWQQACDMVMTMIRKQ